MRKIYPIHNVAEIKHILSIDNMYDSISYDGSPELKDFVPSGVWFMLVDGSDIAGIINCIPLNNVLWSPHIFVLEQYRGKGSEEWGTQVADYMRKNYGAKKFLAFTPYVSAKKYAERIGFQYVTTLTSSIKKNGELLDQYLLELGETE